MAQLRAMQRVPRKVSRWLNNLRWITAKREQIGVLPVRDGSAEELLSLVQQVQQFLAGRSVSDQQVVQILRQHGVWPAAADAVLDYGSMHGYWAVSEGVRCLAPQTWLCQRCGSGYIRPVPCPRCGRSHCPMCLECQQLGMIRGCTRLLQRPHPLGPPLDAVVNLEFPLTEAQARASQFLVDFLDTPEAKAMVWAACGAGKTETVFAAMAEVLRRGGSVLFAIPRRDVVIELQDRLAKAFPTVEQLVLYGGQPWQATAPLTAATTHQVLRFYRRFDLVVLDEVDAFPYHGSQMLRHGMERARKDGGKWIEMTATPVAWPVKYPSITIPARYHGHPLPLPKHLPWKVGASVDAGFHLPAELAACLQDEQPWLVFVPTRQLCQPVAAWLQENVGVAAGYCHSRSDQRQQVLQQLRQGQLRCLVTTTVLERGVTIADVQVAVLWADHPVFSSRSLTQMAGRVGRKAHAASGWVFFAARTMSQAMRSSLQDIDYLNRQAARAGLLHGGILS